MILPAQAEVDRQRLGNFPVILAEESVRVLLGISGRVDYRPYGGLVGIAQKKGREGSCRTGAQIGAQGRAVVCIGPQLIVLKHLSEKTA